MTAKLFKQAAIGALFLFSTGTALSDGLKVFGSEFCTPYDAGACINFDFKKVKNATDWLGHFKYPKGRAAFDECATASDKTDGGLAYCAMVFHREEQSVNKRREMCADAVREKYSATIRGVYAMSLYNTVWNCRQ